jgi:hypothetical protein
MLGAVNAVSNNSTGNGTAVPVKTSSSSSVPKTRRPSSGSNRSSSKKVPKKTGKPGSAERKKFKAQVAEIVVNRLSGHLKAGRISDKVKFISYFFSLLKTFLRIVTNFLFSIYPSSNEVQEKFKKLSRGFTKKIVAHEEKTGGNWEMDNKKRTAIKKLIDNYLQKQEAGETKQ